MKLHRLCDVVPDSTGMLCRPSKWGSVVLAVVFSLAMAFAPVCSWWTGRNRVFGTFIGLVGLIVIPMLIGNVRRAFRPTNWLAWIRFDSLWINVRSDQDDSSTDELCVVQIDYHEIAEVCQHVETYTTPSNRGHSNSRKDTSLDIRLNPTDTSQLEAALKMVRDRPQPERTYLGFIKVIGKPTSFPVSLPEPNLLRVAWYGTAASLRRPLAELAPWVRVGEPTRHDEKDWRDLSDDEFRAQVLRLVRAGDRFGATDLLARRRGLTTTQAIQFVDELERRVD
jgi:hypothetical protein